MTNHVTRLYALAVSVLVLFAAWAVVATHPWQTKGHKRSIRACVRSSPREANQARFAGRPGGS